jgi:hypothetical protein
LRLASLADTDSVNKWIERDSGREVDFHDFLSNGMNACLIEGEGGALFVWRAPGIFEVHVFFEQRGRKVIELSHRMLEFMRSEFGARWFWAAVPIQSRHVIMFTRLMGWKSCGKAMFPHGLCEIFSTENS